MDALKQLFDDSLVARRLFKWKNASFTGWVLLGLPIVCLVDVEIKDQDYIILWTVIIDIYTLALCSIVFYYSSEDDITIVRMLPRLY